MSYWFTEVDLYHRTAIIVDKVLKGAKPADIPIEQPTKFEVVLNLKTASELGIEVPTAILLRADKLIE
jgi:putative tryptophan/tyrosine transport system substrate-binding protein